MHYSQHATRHQWRDERKFVLMLVFCGLSVPTIASELCSLSFQTAGRGEWAIMQMAGEHFVFRTQRKLLEPPAIESIAAYYEVAEDTALEALEIHERRKLSAGSKLGTLLVSRSQAQRIRCNGSHWTVFSFNLANVSWSKAETAPTQALNPSSASIRGPVQAPDVIPKTAIPTVTQSPSFPTQSKRPSNVLTTVEE
jgi:hypothetical protein